MRPIMENHPKTPRTPHSTTLLSKIFGLSNQQIFVLSFYLIDFDKNVKFDQCRLSSVVVVVVKWMSKWMVVCITCGISEVVVVPDVYEHRTRSRAGSWVVVERQTLFLVKLFSHGLAFFSYHHDATPRIIYVCTIFGLHLAQTVLLNSDDSFCT